MEDEDPMLRENDRGIKTLAEGHGEFSIVRKGYESVYFEFTTTKE